MDETSRGSGAGIAPNKVTNLSLAVINLPDISFFIGRGVSVAPSSVLLVRSKPSTTSRPSTRHTPTLRLVDGERVDVEHQHLVVAFDFEVVRVDILDERPPRPRTGASCDSPRAAMTGHHDAGSSVARSTCSLTSCTVEQSAT